LEGTRGKREKPQKPRHVVDACLLGRERPFEHDLQGGSKRAKWGGGVEVGQMGHANHAWLEEGMGVEGRRGGVTYNILWVISFLFVVNHQASCFSEQGGSSWLMNNSSKKGGLVCAGGVDDGWDEMGWDEGWMDS